MEKWEEEKKNKQTKTGQRQCLKHRKARGNCLPEKPIQRSICSVAEVLSFCFQLFFRSCGNQALIFLSFTLTVEFCDFRFGTLLSSTD